MIISRRVGLQRSGLVRHALWTPDLACGM